MLFCDSVCHSFGHKHLPNISKIYRVIEKDGRDLKQYNLKRTGRIYTFGVLKCSEKFKVLDLP